MTETLEAAWEALFDDIQEYEDDAKGKARALALAVLEEASAWVDDLSEDEEYGLGAVRKLRSRIEALGT